MKVIYTIRPPVKSPYFDNLDRNRRNKIETALNKKLTDYEWVEYKKMTIPKRKD